MLDRVAQSLLSQHAVHLLAVGIPVAMVAAGLTWDAVRNHRQSTPRPGRPATPYRSWRRIAALSSAAAAVVHLVVFPEHLGESALYGAFFAGAAAAQLGGAWMLWARASRRLCALAAIGNAGVVALWLATRLISIPVGPASGTTERFGRLDVTASACEVIVVTACLAYLRGRRRVRTPAIAPARRPQLMDVA